MDTVQIFTRCRQWSAWHAIDIICVYCQIRQISYEYSLSIVNGQPDMPLNIICVYCQIRQWMGDAKKGQTLYTASEPISVDTVWIFTWCRQCSTWQVITYYINGTIRLDGYDLNIYLTDNKVILTCHQILCGRYCYIMQIQSEYTFAYAIVSWTAFHLSCKLYHQIIRTVTKSNQILFEWSWFCWIKWIHTKYSLSIGIDPFEGQLDINLVIL